MSPNVEQNQPQEIGHVKQQPSDPHLVKVEPKDEDATPKSETEQVRIKEEQNEPDSAEPRPEEPEEWTGLSGRHPDQIGKHVIKSCLRKGFGQFSDMNMTDPPPKKHLPFATN